MTDRTPLDFAALAEANQQLNAFVDFDRAARFGEGPLVGVTVRALVEKRPGTSASTLANSDSAVADRVSFHSPSRSRTASDRPEGRRS